MLGPLFHSSPSKTLENPVLLHSVVGHKISCYPKEILDFNRKKKKKDLSDLLPRVIEEIIGENKHVPCKQKLFKMISMKPKCT